MDDAPERECTYSPRDAATKTRPLAASTRMRRMTWLSSSLPPTFEAAVKMYAWNGGRYKDELRRLD